MDRVSTERQKNLEIAHSKLQGETVSEKARDAFGRKPYESIAEYAERRVREDTCKGCLGAANGDCGECKKTTEETT